MMETDGGDGAMDHKAHAEAQAEAEEAIHFEEVVRTFLEYSAWMAIEIGRRERHHAALSDRHKSYLPAGEIMAKITGMQSAAAANAIFCTTVVTSHIEQARSAVVRLTGREPPAPAPGGGRPTTPGRHWSKLRSTLHQCVRDWGAEGAEERAQCYTPLIEEVVARLPVTEANRNRIKVLCPGAGLGRLPFEFAARQYACQGNEFSYFMLLTNNYILNYVSRPNSITIFPWIDNPSNCFRNSDVIRAVQIPDVCPGDVLTGIEDSDFSMAAGEFVEVYGGQHGQWDAVVTCFFLDTAANPCVYVETIFNILKPGGYWINLGPLLYHWMDQGDEESDSRYEESVEFSYEEIRAIIRAVGFDVVKEGTRKCSYAANVRSMMRTMYQTVFFVAQKPISAGHGGAGAGGRGSRIVDDSLRRGFGPQAAAPAS